MTTKIKVSISQIKESNDRFKNGHRSEKRYTEHLSYSEINALLKNAFHKTNNSFLQ